VAADDDPGFAAVTRIAKADLGGFGTAGIRLAAGKIQANHTPGTAHRAAERAGIQQMPTCYRRHPSSNGRNDSPYFQMAAHEGY
jgi:hypothetical protein